MRKVSERLGRETTAEDEKKQGTKQSETMADERNWIKVR